MIKIIIGEYKELTHEEALKFFEVDYDSLELIKKGYRGILYCPNKHYIRSAVIKSTSTISDICNWLEDLYEDCQEVVEIIELSEEEFIEKH